MHTLRVCELRVRASLLAVLSAALVLASGAAYCADMSVRGRVTSDNGLPGNSYSVRLISLNDHLVAGSAQVSGDGEFEISDVPTGNYELQVLDGSGAVITREFPSLSGGDVLDVRLPSQTAERPVSGTVSVGQLQRKIPSKARKEFEKAEKATRAGKTQEAIEHLKKAIEIEPAYMEAYNNLGARYLSLGQFDTAADEFQKAAELDQNAAPAFSNLSIALFRLGKLPEAEKAARNAVRLDGANHKARLMLGLILAAVRGHDDEALENLRVVESEFPKARLAAAQILAQQGELQNASIELKKYLASGKVEDRQQVETWLAELERVKSASARP